MEETLTLVVDDDILLRQIEDADQDQLEQLIKKEHENLCRWIEENSLKAMLRVKNFIWVSTMRYMTNGAFDAGIWYRGQLVGMVSLQAINPAKRRSSIGYWLAQDFQGQGIVTKSVRKVVEYAFDVYRLHELRIIAAVENRKSRAVAERLSFRLETIETKAEKINGKFHDVAVYLLRRGVWIRLPNW